MQAVPTLNTNQQNCKDKMHPQHLSQPMNAPFCPSQISIFSAEEETSILNVSGPSDFSYEVTEDSWHCG